MENIVIHDLGLKYEELLNKKYKNVFFADGKYVQCVGCFSCWTKHSTECFIKDKLKNISKKIGASKNLIIITKNYYGMYSPQIKNILDRGIGVSLPLTFYIKGQMHHIPRYKNHEKLIIYVYGKITEDEKATFKFLAERNMINLGYKGFQIKFYKNEKELEKVL